MSKLLGLNTQTNSPLLSKSLLILESNLQLSRPEGVAGGPPPVVSRYMKLSGSDFSAGASQLKRSELVQGVPITFGICCLNKQDHSCWTIANNI